MSKTIFAVDPGSQCGLAVFLDGEPVKAMSVPLKTSRNSSLGMRALELRRRLQDLSAEYRHPAMVAYERVVRHAGTSDAHSYGALMSAIQQWADRRAIPYVDVPVADVKRAATGKGNAKKAAMLDAARERWPDVSIEDDNAADALFIGLCAWQKYGAAL